VNGGRIDDAAQLAEALRARDGRPVRVLGAASHGRLLPPPPDGALLLSLRGLDRIRRLEPDDLTCSVEPGLPCAELRAALAEAGLELPLADGGTGGGTVGGHFALDPVTAANTGAPTARTTLLGVEAVLADGTAFKAGSRVVKSVAGFDVHKLFVGSRGLLFAATLLHLKLRPRAPAAADFCTEPADVDEAARRFVALRRASPAPVQLTLCRDGDGCRVRGRFAGRARWLDEALRAHGLRAGDPACDDGALAPGAGDGGERVEGLVLPSRAASLLRLLPATARARVHGSGRFAVDFAPDHPVAGPPADALLAALPGLAAEGALVAGAEDRRGRATPRDAAAVRLEQGLKRALDPQGAFV
jgi:FAD/FMN-containing dehydrogenase